MDAILLFVKKQQKKSNNPLSGTRGRTRTDKPFGGGFWIPCVYQFRHSGLEYAFTIFKIAYDLSKHYPKVNLPIELKHPKPYFSN